MSQSNERLHHFEHELLPEYLTTCTEKEDHVQHLQHLSAFGTKAGGKLFDERGYRLGVAQKLFNVLLKSVTGRVLSSVHKLASHYETSNAKVNKLWENITWSTYGNFLSIPTDCPQRNERMGWSGDISVFSRTATYLADLPQFLRRHMLTCATPSAPMAGSATWRRWAVASVACFGAVPALPWPGKATSNMPTRHWWPNTMMR